MGRIVRFFKAVGRGISAGTSWLNKKLKDFQILILSAAVVFLYLILLCIGVMNQNRLLIVLCGVVTSLYFACVVFLALEWPSLFSGLVSRAGLTLTNGKWSAKDKKSMRCLWFLAVAPLFFVFWLAMFPSRGTGLLTIITATCLLTLLIISHWQKIPSNFWKAYYNFAKKAFPVTIILVFVVYTPFASFWNGLGKFVVVKSQQAAVWLSSPPKAEKRAVKPMKKTVVAARKHPRPLTKKSQSSPPAKRQHLRPMRKRMPSDGGDALSRAAQQYLRDIKKIEGDLDGA